jgi:signal transduction histidine kinase
LLTNSAAQEFQGDLTQLRLSGDELNRYIQSILKLLRIESRDFKLNIGVADFNQIVEEVLSQLRPLAQERNQSFATDLEPLFSIEIDETLIREVVLNLIENAMKYSPVGASISVSSFEQDGRVIFKVIDQGSGIPPEELPMIWGKFVRGKEQNLKTKGSGLGLYLVKYFIELHGGAVQVESELGKGTTVTFSLPLDEGET